MRSFIKTGCQASFQHVFLPAAAEEPLQSSFSAAWGTGKIRVENGAGHAFSIPLPSFSREVI